MKDELTVKDFYLFIKDNLKLILTTMLLLLALLMVIFAADFFSADSSESTEETSEMSDSNTENYERLAELPFELLTGREVTFLQDYVEETSYKFMFFIDNTNNEPIGNLNMMRAIFRHPNVVERIEERIGEELTPDPTISINLVSYADSGLFELQLGRQTTEESQLLAQSLFEMIENEEIPVLNQFNITLFEDNPIPLTEPIETDEVDETIVVERNNVELVRSAVIYLVIGVVGGLILGAAVALIKMIFTDKITALFNYEKEFTDRIVRFNHMKVDNKELFEKIQQNIIYPKQQKKLVIYDTEQLDNSIDLIDKIRDEENVEVIKDFSDLDQSKLFDEVILVTEVNTTSKKWYNDQRLQLSGYTLPVKVIQL